MEGHHPHGHSFTDASSWNRYQQQATPCHADWEPISLTLTKLRTVLCLYTVSNQSIADLKYSNSHMT